MEETTRRRTNRAFALGFWGNGALAVSKLAAGWITGSVALVADGWHSLSDILINGGAWIAHRVAVMPPDEDHHYGHGHAESAAGALVGGVLLVGGVTLAWTGAQQESALAENAAGLLALVVASVSIVANVGLAWMSATVGREAGSPGLRALARDNASDALAGVMVVLGILGSRAGIAWAEPVVAVAIGAMIAVMGFRSLREGMDVLMARVPDRELRERLSQAARGVQGVKAVQRVRVHPLGTLYRADIEISVDGQLTVEDGHRIAHRVEATIIAGPTEVKAVDVHVNPWNLGEKVTTTGQ